MYLDPFVEEVNSESQIFNVGWKGAVTGVALARKRNEHLGKRFTTAFLFKHLPEEAREGELRPS